MQRHRTASVLAASFWITSCCLGCSDEGGSGGDGGGAAGSSASGSSHGGSSAGGSASGSGTGGSANGGTASGTGGSGPPPEVFNPALPKPTHDCLTDPAIQCLAIRGTLLGEAIDTFCTKPQSTSGFFPDPDAWPVFCQEGVSAFKGLYYQLQVPVQGPGPFHHVVEDSDDSVGAEVWVTMDDVGGRVRDEHLRLVEMAGTVGADALGRRLISGTYRATWDAPDPATCTPSCGAVDVHGSFRFVNTGPLP